MNLVRTVLVFLAGLVAGAALLVLAAWLIEKGDLDA